MSTEVRVLCTPAAAPGFRLAGVPVVVARDADDAERRLRDLRAEGETGLLLVEDRLYDALDPGGTRRATGLPITVPFPGPAWEEAALDDRVIEILRRAIGYRVRLR